MNMNKDFWSYGAYIEDEFYGPLEVFEVDEFVEPLQEAGYSWDLEDPDNASFTLPNSEVTDIEGFTASAKELLAENGINWDHADNL